METNQAGDEQEKGVMYKNINPLKLSWCDKKTKFMKESRFSSKITSLNIDYKEMHKLIRCLDCHGVPHPQWRFMCLQGHMFCYKCGKNRCGKNGEVCLYKPESKESEDKQEPQCQSNLKQVKNDPIYAAIIGQSFWLCPNRKKGCQIRAWGPLIFRHYKYCKAKYEKKDKAMAEAIARWENDEDDPEPIPISKDFEDEANLNQIVPEPTSTEDECWD